MATSKISLYFLGTDEFASVVLSRLAMDELFEVRGVVVPPDRPQGRKKELRPCPVKARALELGLEISVDPQSLLEKEVDFLIVASYGHLLSKEVLSVPRVASLNVHGSLLPQYRGASPIQAALLNGDRVTGVCLQRMVSKLDAGPVYSFSEVAIRSDHDAATLREEMSEFGAELVAQSLSGIRDGDIEALQQDESSVSYSPKIDRSSGEIQWSSLSAIQVERTLKAYTPWPGIYTFLDGKRLKLLGGHAEMHSGVPGEVKDAPLSVGTSDGVFVLDRIQLEGKNAVSAQDFVRGNPSFVGSVLW